MNRQATWAKPAPRTFPLPLPPQARLEFQPRSDSPHGSAEAQLARLGAETVRHERRLEGLAMGFVALSGVLCLALAFGVGTPMTQYFSAFSAWIAQVAS